MEFKCVHCNINITNIEKSVSFYQKALGLKVERTKEASDGSFILTYLGDGISNFQIELTWLKDHPQAYDLGENESHICFEVDDYEKAYQLHKELDVFVLKIKRWDYTLLMILMIIGLKFYQKNNAYSITDKHFYFLLF